MAVEDSSAGSKSVSTARRFLVGSNVIVSILLVGGIAAVLQAMAYSGPSPVDMTSSRVNSLTEGTENLIRDLDVNVRLTSLYFETDLEEEDQQRYRRAVSDLLDLYESTNRSSVAVDRINPLSDHEKYGKLRAGLLEKTAFKAETAAYLEHISKFQDDLFPRMGGLVQSELGLLSGLGSAFGGQPAASPTAPIEQVFEQWKSELQTAGERIEALMSTEIPQYSGVLREITSVYGSFVKTLKDVGAYSQAQIAGAGQMPASQAAYLREVSQRLSSLLSTIEEEQEQADGLEPLSVDDVFAQLGPTTNAILVETEDDARVVDFSSVWPPLMPDMPTRKYKFKDRAFKGQEKLTSAILRVTHQEQTAVVFVRYGGPPLFLGGFMPGQPAAPFSVLKGYLQDANFVVREWDLKTQDHPPEIEPAPTRVVYVVFKPNPPQRGPMGQPSQDPAFGEGQRRALVKAVGDSGRALFVGGWTPGAGSPFPAGYEYSDYLEETWGVGVDAGTLLVKAISIGPGKYGFSRDPISIAGFEFGQHDITTGATVRRLTLPVCSPLNVSEQLPEDVAIQTLVTAPMEDGLWGVRDVRKYQEQAAGEYVTKVEGDLEGPFTLAVAGTKGDDKVVIISSTSFAVDEVAFSQEMAVTAQGLTVRSRNPGNATLLINALHWLSDNSEFMNVGRPIDAAVLQIENPATLTWVKVLTIFVWPALACGCGLVVWWVRRG